MERAERARAFGKVADEYERGRPGYPRAAVEWLLRRPGTGPVGGAGPGSVSGAGPGGLSGPGLGPAGGAGPGPVSGAGPGGLSGPGLGPAGGAGPGGLSGPGPLDVVDLAAGTGKLTRVVLECGHRVRAVEPLAEMRAVLAASAPGAVAIDGSAERMPLVDASADAVVVGAAFHWFDHELALAEITRVLRAPGILGLFGNGLDDSVPWIASLRQHLGSRRPGEHDRRWPAPARLEEQFESVEEAEFPQLQSIDLAGLRDLALSRSSVALMPEDEREKLFEDLRELWEEQVGEERATLAWRTRVLRAAGLR